MIATKGVLWYTIQPVRAPQVGALYTINMSCHKMHAKSKALLKQQQTIQTFTSWQVILKLLVTTLWPWYEIANIQKDGLTDRWTERLQMMQTATLSDPLDMYNLVRIVWPVNNNNNTLVLIWIADYKQKPKYINNVFMYGTWLSIFVFTW